MQVILVILQALKNSCIFTLVAIWRRKLGAGRTSCHEALRLTDHSVDLSHFVCSCEKKSCCMFLFV
jgi:hypothetical protein